MTISWTCNRCSVGSRWGVRWGEEEYGSSNEAAAEPVHEAEQIDVVLAHNVLMLFENEVDGVGLAVGIGEEVPRVVFFIMGLAL